MPHRPLPPGHLLQWMNLQGHIIAGPSFLAFGIGVIRPLPLALFSSHSTTSLRVLPTSTKGVLST